MALKRLEGCRTLAEGTKAIINLGLENVPVPGESGFPFPGLFPLPQSQKEAGEALSYVVSAFSLSTIYWIPFGVDGVIHSMAFTLSYSNLIFYLNEAFRFLFTK